MIFYLNGSEYVVSGHISDPNLEIRKYKRDAAGGHYEVIKYDGKFDFLKRLVEDAKKEGAKEKLEDIHEILGLNEKFKEQY